MKKMRQKAAARPKDRFVMWKLSRGVGEGGEGGERDVFVSVCS